MGEAIAHFVLQELKDDDMAPPPRQAGSVVGLQRLIMDGDVFHARASELLTDGRLQADADIGPDAEED